MDRPAEGDEAMGGQEVAAAEWLVSLFMFSIRDLCWVDVKMNFRVRAAIFPWNT
jgi:hypothetical protein